MLPVARVNNDSPRAVALQPRSAEASPDVIAKVLVEGFDTETDRSRSLRPPKGKGGNGNVNVDAAHSARPRDRGRTPTRWFFVP